EFGEVKANRVPPLHSGPPAPGTPTAVCPNGRTGGGLNAGHLPDGGGGPSRPAVGVNPAFRRLNRANAKLYALASPLLLSAVRPPAASRRWREGPRPERNVFPEALTGRSKGGALSPSVSYNRQDVGRSAVARRHAGPRPNPPGPPVPSPSVVELFRNS